jgi:capsular exopolysaccharide synthesis family protein
MEIIQSRTPSDMAANDATTPRSLPLVEQIDVREIGRVLRRGIWVIVWSILFVMVLGAAAVFSIVPQYTAAAFVEINPSQKRIVNFEAVLSGLPADTATMGTETEILRSRKLAERTVEKLNLYSYPEFNSVLRAPSPLRRLANTVLTELGLENWIPAQNPTQEEAAEAPGSEGSEFRDRSLLSFFRNRDGLHESLARMADRERSSVVDAYLRRLTIKPQGRSRVIGIYFQSEDPQTAARIANTTADLYIVAQLEAKFEAAKLANSWLNDRISTLRQEVKTAEQSVEQFRKKSGLLRGGKNATLVDEQVSQLNARYITERNRLGDATARMRQAEKLLKSPRGIESAGAVLNSQAIRDLRREESQVARKLAELSNEYGDRHPRMINARAEQVNVRKKLRVEIDKVIQSMRNEVSEARTRALSLFRALETLRNEVGRLNTADVQLRALEREGTASRQLLEQLLSRSKQLVSRSDFQQPDATIITVAPVPEKQTSPKTAWLFTLLFALGACIGLFGAFLVDRLDHGYRSADEIMRDLGVSALGLIPTVGKLKALGKGPQDYCIENLTSAFSEALRSLHTNLLLADVGNRPRVVLIASALPNEGKTSLVVSLARVLSSAGQAVVVVDCDLRRPSVHKVFGAKDGPGLGECVNGKLTLDSVIQEDTVSGAHFIRAGERPPNSPDLFDSVGFQQLLKTLSRSYDLVLLDSAPVLAISDTLFLGRLVNKTILVVRWAKTRRAQVELALKKLVEARADVAGVLLSMVDVEDHSRYGYSDSGTYSGSLKKYYAG